ncbi:unnamed protein product [Auanema sp. JU1783]|nr:unnamed protein product [Auanema sp. JU1783]
MTDAYLEVDSLSSVSQLEYNRTLYFHVPVPTLKVGVFFHTYNCLDSIILYPVCFANGLSADSWIELERCGQVRTATLQRENSGKRELCARVSVVRSRHHSFVEAETLRDEKGWCSFFDGIDQESKNLYFLSFCS